MKITYLKLKNFASIYSAMNKRELVLDLSQSKNRIIIIAGANGSGKTSILSTLHPYATNGLMDDRDDRALILDGEEGYKEIHIVDSDNMYIIKHFYYWNKNPKGTKSFIMKNDVELNPNGNITSFKEVISQEFSLEMDYLKLIRLGNNVTNFINMKSFDRKQFTANFLSDVDIYASILKKINNSSKSISTLVNTVSDKLRRLNILDIDSIKQYLSDTEDRLSKAKKNLEKVQSVYWKDTGEMNTINKNPKSFLEEFNNMNEEMNNLITMDHIKSTPASLTKKLNKEKDRNVQLLVTQSQIAKDIESINDNLNRLNIDLEKSKNDLSFIQSDKNIDDYRVEITDLKKTIESLRMKYSKYKPEFTKSDILEYLAIGQAIESSISDLLSVSGEIVEKSIDLHSNGKSIESYVFKKIQDIDKGIKSFDKDMDNYIFMRPVNCHDYTCPFYDYVMSKEDNNSSKKESTKSREYYEYFLVVNKTLSYIDTMLKVNIPLISRLPFKYLERANIFKSILNKTKFIDEKDINEYIAMVEEFDSIIYLNNKLQNLEKEFSFMEKNETSIKRLRDSLTEIESNIIKLGYLKKDKQNKQSDIIEELSQSSDKIGKLTSMISDVERYSELKDKIKKDSSIIDRVKILNERIEENSKMIIYFKDEISDLEKEIENTRFRIKEFKNLNKELDKLIEDSEKVTILKKALSSNTGIPLIFITLYLNNSKIMVNNLLQVVYGGSLEILDYVVEKEFTIPYMKNNIIIDDVIRASEGEKAFISIALSFALLYESVKKYNIMLLDEMDGSLDPDKRLLFIKILERQLNLIGSEQVFMITHNNMFDNYPVDIIRTSDVSLDNYQEVNILY
ncbi:MAG: AAA family ATPase [Herbinix sp.]|nr:AAA family ATPase [Herbinix sp.]